MRSTRSHSMPAAFTLIELVTVIVLLGIVGVFVGGPIMSTIGDVKSNAAPPRLAADIRYIQRIALSSGWRTRIVVDNAGDRYTLFMEDSDPLNPWKPVRDPVNQSIDPIQFNVGPFAGVTIDTVNINGTSVLEFDNFGVPFDANGNALSSASQIVLSNGIAVQIHPVSGYVEQVQWP